MPPSIVPFHVADLETRTKILPTGKARKPDASQPLDECQLKELVQFECDVKRDPKHKYGLVLCQPIIRLFRRCKDGSTVETTAWETEN